MAILHTGWKGNLTGGPAIGVGSAVLAPIVIPLLASVVKPPATSAIKGGYLVLEKGKEMAAETQEVLKDVVAEAKSEITKAQRVTAAPATEIPAEGPDIKS